MALMLNKQVGIFYIFKETVAQTAHYDRKADYA